MLLLCFHRHPLELSTLCSPFPSSAGQAGGALRGTQPQFWGDLQPFVLTQPWFINARVSLAPRVPRVLQGWCCWGTPGAPSAVPPQTLPPAPLRACPEPRQGLLLQFSSTLSPARNQIFGPLRSSFLSLPHSAPPDVFGHFQVVINNNKSAESVRAGCFLPPLGLEGSVFFQIFQLLVKGSCHVGTVG